MAGDNSMPAGIDQGTHGKDPVSRRARAEHYRHYAAEFRALAETRPAGAIRDRLTALASQYDVLARAAWRLRDNSAPADRGRKRRAAKRDRGAVLAS
jgi:hypothetical protein